MICGAQIPKEYKTQQKDSIATLLLHCTRRHHPQRVYRFRGGGAVKQVVV